MKVVLVKWMDAYSMDEWQSKAELDSKLDDQPEGTETITPGILYRETDHVLVLIQNFQEETPFTGTDYSGIMVIPKGMVREVKVLLDE